MVNVDQYLVGGIPTPLKKYEFVNWDDDSQYMESHKRGSSHHQPDIDTCRDGDKKMNRSHGLPRGRKFSSSASMHGHIRWAPSQWNELRSKIKTTLKTTYVTIFAYRIP